MPPASRLRRDAMINTHAIGRILRPLARSAFAALMIAVLLLGWAPRPALAQTDYGTLVIIVTEPDPSRPGVQASRLSSGQKVTVKGERGTQRSCVTKADGACRFGSLE